MAARHHLRLGGPLTCGTAPASSTIREASSYRSHQPASMAQPSSAPEPFRTDYRLFGMQVSSTLRLPGAWGFAPSVTDATVLRTADLPSWTGTAEGGWRGLSDGAPFMVERSHSDQHRFSHGDRPLFQLSSDRMTLCSAPGELRDLRWWRILMDSVLFTVSLLRGNESIHAGAVATSSGAVAILSPSGSGKSTLLGQLLGAGHSLITDDVLFLEAAENEVLAHPGPPLMTLPGKRAGSFGTRIGETGDEVWLSVPVTPEAVPLQRMVLLDRRPASPVSMRRVKEPLVPLLARFLGFPQVPEREIARFVLASAVASASETWHLAADTKTPPEQLAALAVQGLPS